MRKFAFAALVLATWTLGCDDVEHEPKPKPPPQKACEAFGFNGATDYTTASSPYASAGGDFDGDGNVDLLVANNTSGNVTVLKGDSKVKGKLIPGKDVPA